MATSTQSQPPSQQPDAPQVHNSRAAARRPNGQPTDETAAQLTEQVRDATAETTAALSEIMRQSQEGVARTVQIWTELLTRMNPVALFARPQRADQQVVPARAVVDGGYELVEMVLVAQRRYVDQLVTAQRQFLLRLIDAGAALASATRTGGGGVETQHSYPSVSA